MIVIAHGPDQADGCPDLGQRQRGVRAVAARMALDGLHHGGGAPRGGIGIGRMRPWAAP